MQYNFNSFSFLQRSSIEFDIAEESESDRRKRISIWHESLLSWETSRTLSTMVQLMALGPLQADCIYIYQLLQRILVLLRLCLPCEHAEKFSGFVNKIYCERFGWLSYSYSWWITTIRNYRRSTMMVWSLLKLEASVVRIICSGR